MLFRSHQALTFENYEMLRLLLTLGADPSCKDGHQYSVPDCFDISKACSRGQVDIVKLYLDVHGNPDHCAYNTRLVPLHIAVKEGHLNVVKMLAEAGADLNAKADDKWGDTALHIAANYDRREILKYLIDAGADVNGKAKDGTTPLFHACGVSDLIDNEPYKSKGLVEIARLLLEHHADANVKNNNGNTPMHCAAWKGLVDVTGVLWGFGARNDVTNNQGQTPRDRAVEFNNPAWIEAVDRALTQESTVNMQMNLAARVFGQGLYSKALIACKQTLEGNAGCSWPRITISSIVSGFAGICCLEEGQTENALTYLQQAVKECAWIPEYSDNRDEFVGYLGLAYSRLGMNDKAEPLMREAIERLEYSSDYLIPVKMHRNLAEHYLRLDKADQALDEIEKAMAIAKKAGDNQLLVKILQEETLNYDAAHKFDYAVKTLTLALELARNYSWKEAEAWFLSDLGHASNKAEQADKALAYYHEAIEKARANGFNDVLAASLTGYSSSLADLGRGAEAVAPAKEAGALYSAMGDEASALTMANQCAVILHGMGHYDEALSQFETVLQASRKINKPEVEANALGNLGFCYLRLGQYGKACEMLQQAIDMCVAQSQQNDEATYRVHLGSAYAALGERSKAFECHTEARNLFEKQGSKRGQAMALNGIAGVLLDKGQIAEALDIYNDILKFDRELGDEELLETTLNNIGRAYKENKEFDKAEASYREAISLAKQRNRPDETTASLNNLASLLQGQGKIDEALALYLEGLETVKDSGFQADQATLYRNIGHLYLGQGNFKAAEENLRSCVYALECQRSSTSGSLARSFMDEEVHAYELLAEAQMHLQEHEEAWHTIESMRARDLVSKLQEKGSYVPAPTPEEMGKWIDENTLLLVYANSTLEEPARLHLAHGGSLQGDLLALGKMLKTLNEEFKELNEEFLDRESEESPIKDILIGPADRNIIYWGGLYRFLLSHPEPQYRKPRERLARLLYDAYLGGLEKALEGKDELIISPDRVLSEIPIETLIGPDGKYVIEHFNVQYIHSLTIYNVLRHRPHLDGDKEMLVVANPEYAQTPDTNPPQPVKTVGEARGLEAFIHQQISENRSLCAAYARLGATQWPNLEGTQTEADAIAAIIKDATVLQGKEASERNLKRLDADHELASFKNIHIASHGFALFGFERLIALVLSLDSSTPDNHEGYLTLDELRMLNLQADLVTLSACSTGVGSFYGGEGIVGLPNALITAGANSVVVSQWQVADESTAKLMMGAYGLMKEKNMSFDRALTEMKRAFIEGRVSSEKLDITRGVVLKKRLKVNNINKYSDPFFWAPFIFYGLPPQKVMTPDTVPAEERHLMPGFGC
ncbi:MAG: CHAT domain-containing protein [Planctomycetota bacterium]